MDLVDLLHPEGVENPGGIASIHGVALLGDFTTIQAVKGLQDVGATMQNIAQINVPHVFAVGKSMRKLYCTLKKGNIKSDAVGDYDGVGHKTTATIFVPGNDPAVHGSVRLLENSNAIYFIKQSDNTVSQVGNEAFPAKTKGSFDTMDNEGVRGTTLTIETYARPVDYLPGLNFTPAVAPLPATITTQPVGGAAAIGSSKTFTIAASNYSSINWFKGATPLNVNALTLTLNNLQVADAATYHAEVVGLDGVTVVSNNAILTVS